VDAIKLLRTALFALCACAVTAIAQQYPTKPIRVIVGQPPGGGVDTSARAVSSKLSPLLGQQVVVENRSGAAGTIGAAAVAAAPPDGYTLHYAGTALLIASSVYTNLPFDLTRSFTAIGGVGLEHFVLVVNPALPAKNTAELIALLKANPGKYSYASAGVGSPHHLTMELFKKQAGVEAVHIPYKGASQILPDLVGGVLPIAIMSASSTISQAKAGKLRVIGITSLTKLATVPDWPVLADQLPGFDTSANHFIVAPAGTSPQVVARLSEALKVVLAADDIKQSFLARGVTAEFVAPEALALRIQSEARKWGTVAKESGATPD
jgi:tripartite-type tricarboxylate transporter receptor subunit TctC